ncbi:MAG: hypothetical protein Q7U91_00115 [Sideroxyarcus sp.]|nr:hypothetical protein [Sideroxyarcus sp.]
MVVLAPCQLPAKLEALAERIVAALQKEADNFSASGASPKIELAALQITRVVDPGNQLPGYEGVWRNARNDRCGTLTINSDNSFFAEYDLFCPHPRDSRWFVEMVTAWGNEASLRSEATLIPAL